MHWQKLPGALFHGQITNANICIPHAFLQKNLFKNKHRCATHVLKPAQKVSYNTMNNNLHSLNRLYPKYVCPFVYFCKYLHKTRLAHARNAPCILPIIYTIFT